MTPAQRRAFDKQRCALLSLEDVFEIGWDAAPKPPKWLSNRPTKKGLYVYKAHTGVQGVTVLIREDRHGLYTRGLGVPPVEPDVKHRQYRTRSWPDGFWYPIQECGESTIDL